MVHNVNMLICLVFMRRPSWIFYSCPAGDLMLDLSIFTGIYDSDHFVVKNTKMLWTMLV